MDALLQAHRGVSTDYPENTAIAVSGAACQGYKIVEIDPAVTKDGEIVLLHDKTINRTARNKDGRKLSHEIFINDITYEELLNLDFGVWFSHVFKGEKIPLLSEILEIARTHGVLIKIDNKFQSFSEESMEKLYNIVNSSGARVAFTVNSADFAKQAIKAVPKAYIHYDGDVTESVLQQLVNTVSAEKLTVWLPYPTKHNTWVKVPYVNEELCELVKKYAELGLWILSEENEYKDAVARFSPHIIETTGKLKPKTHNIFVADIHTHSEHSHDSLCKISAMADGQMKKGTAVFAVTDHCDIEFFETQDLKRIIGDSVSDTKKHNADIDGVEILAGVEIGEAFWHNDIARKVISENKYDVIIGSVHAVQFENLTMPYSTIDFGKLGKKISAEYLEKYFDDVAYMIENTEFDVLAHLTCPLRYINGKYGLNINCKDYREKIEGILKRVIEKNIVLEVNTSCKGSSYNEFMPEEWIIKLYGEMDGALISLGSDAHIKENASHCFNEAIAMLKANGFVKACYLKNRKIYQYAI